MTHLINPVCSNKPRPSVHTGRKGGQFKTGACLWGRDVFHAQKSVGDSGYSGMTVCGIEYEGWLKIPPMDIDSAIADDNFCNRCSAKILKETV